MKITELTKPLNKVLLKWNGRQVPAMVFSGQPASTWKTVLAFVLLEVPPSIVYAKADDVLRPLEEPSTEPSAEPAEEVETDALRPRVSPSAVTFLPKGVPYKVTLRNQEDPKRMYLSFAFTFQGKPCWSTPIPLTRPITRKDDVPPIKDRLLVPTTVEFVKVERLSCL